MAQKKSYVKVEGPASPQVRRVMKKMHSPEMKNIEKVVVEPTAKPHQLGYVTNIPEEKGVIHIPEKNIETELKRAQPGVDPQQLKEQKETFIEDVVVPHEQSHAEDVIKGEGEFSPTSEQQARKEEDWSRMEEYGLQPRGRFAMDIIEIMDKIASSLQSQGAVDEASEVDMLTNTMEKFSFDMSEQNKMMMEKIKAMPELVAKNPWLGNLLKKDPKQLTREESQNLYELMEKESKKSTGEKLMGQPTSQTTKTITAALDGIADSLQKQGLKKEATEIDIITNTIEKTAKEKKWIQKAVPESHEGKFGKWCKSHGFEEGVCQSCIDKAIAEGGNPARMANFAINVSKGKYHHPKDKKASIDYDVMSV